MWPSGWGVKGGVDRDPGGCVWTSGWGVKGGG